MPLRRLSRFLFLSSAVCLVSQCEKPAPATAAGASGPALATVAGQAITEKDLLQEAEWRRSNNQAVPPAPELLQEMVNRLALVEKAKRDGVADDPATQRRIQSVIVASLRAKQFDAELAKVAVSDEEIAKAYEARRAEFTRPGLDRFAILFQAADAKASDARKAEAKKKLEDALVLADANPAPGGRGPAAGGFGQVAAQHSDDQVSRYKGGDVGWIETGAKETRLPANVIEAGRALEKGKRSGVIEAADGYYVILKSDARPGGARALEEVADNLRQQLLRDKRRAMEEGFLADAISSSKASIDTAAAAKVSLPDSGSPPAPANTAPELSPP